MNKFKIGETVTIKKIYPIDIAKRTSYWGYWYNKINLFW